VWFLETISMSAFMRVMYEKELRSKQSVEYFTKQAKTSKTSQNKLEFVSQPCFGRKGAHFGRKGAHFGEK
jgi:hypothetical protein